MLDKTLKTTRSRCRECAQDVEAEVVRKDGRVVMRKSCPSHGDQQVCISSDARFYWLSKGDPRNEAVNGGCCGSGIRSASDNSLVGIGGKNLGLTLPLDEQARFQQLSTCVALIEIVSSCNLSCPVCYADSPVGYREKVQSVPLDVLKRRIEGIVYQKGQLDILQLSGGEPTLHPHFFELVDWILTTKAAQYLLINSNGVRLAQDPAFAEKLSSYLPHSNLQLYLQFDGPQEVGQVALRGADLRSIKTRAVERALEGDIPITLAMTLTEENSDYVWDAVEWGLQYKNIRGITFQPMFSSGRGISRTRLNAADIILRLIHRSGGILDERSFTPLPCGDPNCAIIGYLFKVHGTVCSASNFFDFSQVQGFLQDRIRYELQDLLQCGCESEPLADILRQFELDESHTFRLFIKPFMDNETWDQDRVDRCCTHVIPPEGKLDSFCRYYSKR